MSFEDDLDRMDVLQKEFLDHCENEHASGNPEDFHRKIMGCVDLLSEVCEVDQRITDHVVKDLTLEFE